MNETVNLMITRRSVRKFKSDMIPKEIIDEIITAGTYAACLLYTSPSPRDRQKSRMPSSA